MTYVFSSTGSVNVQRKRNAFGKREPGPLV